MVQEEVASFRRVTAKIVGAVALIMFVAMTVAIAQHWWVFIPMLAVPLALAYIAVDMYKWGSSRR